MRLQAMQTAYHRNSFRHNRLRHGTCPRTIALAFAAVLFLVAPATGADFKAGWKAYEKGDFSGAFNEWGPLAESGDPRAQFNLGVLYDEGKGVVRDRSLAIEWWTRAAKNGDPQAQHNIALAYLAGTGVPRNFETAIGWLKKSANQGVPRSQYTLGRVYDYGMGVVRNPTCELRPRAA